MYRIALTNATLKGTITWVFYNACHFEQMGLFNTAMMRKLSIRLSALTLILLFLTRPSIAQDRQTPLSSKRNDLNGYAGIFELNLNYERTLSERMKSLSNVRLGAGYGMFYVAGEGYFMDGAFVQLFGAGNSHLEMDAGLKFMLTNSIADPAVSEQLLPDIFLGYRFQKRAGGFILRAGIDYPTVLNIGTGYAF